MFAYNRSKGEKYCKSGYIVFAFLSALFGGFVCGACSLIFASGPYSMEVWQSYFANPYIMLLNLAVPMLLSALFYLIFNRAYLSFIATNVVVIIPTLINYYKIAFRGDCFIAADMSLALESSKMLETYKLFIDKRIVGYLAVLACGIAMLCFFVRGRFKTKRRLFAVILPVALFAALLPLYMSQEVYDKKTDNSIVERQWTESRRYISKGFVYPFIHSFKELFKEAPLGYDKDEAEAILSGYTAEEIPDDKKINIVCVMLEAYNDFSRFEQLSFTEDIYAKYRELESIGYSGTLVTDVFAGDTRITEREFLTGMPYARMDSFAKNANSYVWYLRENGYATEGSHPCNAWFYNRQNINKNLGFENYYFTENYYKERTGGDITWDGGLFPIMRDIYLERDKSKPYFSFSITYQGHGPYDSNTANFEAPYVESGHVSESDKNIMNNYLNAQKGTTDYLYTFAKEMLATKEPLVLVFFGDHKPWMGNGGGVYGAYGINIDTSTEDGFMNYYSTRYLILANDAAKEISGNSFSGEGETLSVSFLMNKVFELCGYEGNEYMQFTSEVMKESPVIHRDMDMTSGAPLKYDCVSYYYRRNFIY